MTKIFKNMAPYWYMIVGMVLLRIVQAVGDLSMPQYFAVVYDFEREENMERYL